MQKNEQYYRFGEEDVKRLAAELYGIRVSVKPLDSYWDQNFLVTDEKKNRFIFKIANPQENWDALDAQNKAMEHMAGNKLVTWPEICPTKKGGTITPIQDPFGTVHWVRMLTYLPGTFLAYLDAHSPQLLEDFGRFLGSMDKTLASFHHPALYRYMTWDLKNTADLEDYLDDIEDIRLRNLVNYFLQQFKTFVVPVFPKLRTGIIHNDANDYNVLADEKGTKITGIIDFGDMVFTHVVNELAIAAAYAVHGKDDPIETAARLTAGYHTVYPLTDSELAVLFHLICARLCATLLVSANQLKKDPDNEYLHISVAPAREALEKLISVNPRQVENAFRKACGLSVIVHGLDPEEILKIREKHLGKALSVSYKKPLKIVRGAMQYLYDHYGRAYLDTVNNVCHVGHCHPRVVKAAQEQIALLNTNTRYLHDNIVEYARRLTACLPEPLSVCFFVCTGSEANELAIRMARTHTGNTDFVVVDHAYHGNTNAVIEISPYKFDGPGGKGCPAHIHKALMPDTYRGPHAGGPNCLAAPGEKYAEDVHRALKEIETQGKKAAAFIHESLPSVGGQIIPPKNYLKEAYRYAREAGSLCIADEVQVGFGRVGSHMWAFETQGVVPDIVTMGKPIGNGHPLAAVVTTPEIADSFSNGMEYFNTFGGNPVSCAVGLAVLNVIKDEKLQENALEVGEYFKTGLAQLIDKHPLIGDVRGLGLFLGIELVRDRETLEPAVDESYYIAERMKEEGILVSVDGPLYNVLKIKPPLVFTKANAQLYIDTLDKVMSEKAFPSF
jgi:4-aminobutyrate aminotransferase-like enzyme